MDNFFGMVNESWFWRYFLSHFGWVDWGLVIFLLLGILMGLKQGLSRELPRLLESLISLYVTLEYSSLFAAWLSRETPWPESYLKIFTFAVVGTLSGLLLRLLFEILGRLASLQIASPFQEIGGFLIGGGRYFIFFSLLSYFLLLFPLDWIHQSYQVQSWSGQIVAQVPSKIHDWVNGVVLRRRGTA